MFFLSELEHKLRLPADKIPRRPEENPEEPPPSLESAIREQLEHIFLDKVIPKLGLCISVYDIRNISGGFILAGEGAPTYTVVFRLIMFRPYAGEVLSAKVKESNPDGLRLSLGFFDDIQVPGYLLPDPSHSEPDPDNIKQVMWKWECNDEIYEIYPDEEVRFRVSSIDYPPIPLEQKPGAKPFAPMVIIGAMNGVGLGPVIWWV